MEEAAYFSDHDDDDHEGGRAEAGSSAAAAAATAGKGAKTQTEKAEQKNKEKSGDKDDDGDGDGGDDDGEKKKESSGGGGGGGDGAEAEPCEKCTELFYAELDKSMKATAKAYFGWVNRILSSAPLVHEKPWWQKALMCRDGGGGRGGGGFLPQDATRALSSRFLFKSRFTPSPQDGYGFTCIAVPPCPSLSLSVSRLFLMWSERE